MGGRNVELAGDRLRAEALANALYNPVNGKPRSLEISNTPGRGVTQINLREVAAAKPFLNETRPQVSRLVTKLCRQSLQSAAHPNGDSQRHDTGLISHAPTSSESSQKDRKS